MAIVNADRRLHGLASWWMVPAMLVVLPAIAVAALLGQMGRMVARPGRLRPR